MHLNYNTWRYKEDGEARLFKAGQQFDENIWKDSPACFKKEETEEEILENLSKNDLEKYAKEKFSVDLDKRKSKKTLIQEIITLEGE